MAVSVWMVDRLTATERGQQGVFIRVWSVSSVGRQEGTSPRYI